MERRRRRTGETHALAFLDTWRSSQNPRRARRRASGRLAHRFDGREFTSRPREDEGPYLHRRHRGIRLLACQTLTARQQWAGLLTPLMPKPLRAMMLRFDPSTTSAVHRTTADRDFLRRRRRRRPDRGRTSRPAPRRAHDHQRRPPPSPTWRRPRPDLDPSTLGHGDFRPPLLAPRRVHGAHREALPLRTRGDGVDAARGLHGCGVQFTRRHWFVGLRCPTHQSRCGSRINRRMAASGPTLDAAVGARRFNVTYILALSQEQACDTRPRTPPTRRPIIKRLPQSRPRPAKKLCGPRAWCRAQ